MLGICILRSCEVENSCDFREPQNTNKEKEEAEEKDEKARGTRHSQRTPYIIITILMLSFFFFFLSLCEFIFRCWVRSRPQ